MLKRIALALCLALAVSFGGITGCTGDGWKIRIGVVAGVCPYCGWANWTHSSGCSHYSGSYYQPPYQPPCPTEPWCPRHHTNHHCH